MISVGSRDWYGVEGGKMELESEFEEGEAYFHNNNKYDDYDDDDDDGNDDGDDDSRIDPDVSLSYIDEKIQDVLGHCQKEFEGGVSAEKLGSKFGGYGSFLPTYQRSPVLPQSKTPPNVPTYSAPISPNNAFVEVGHQNPVSQSSASQHARLVPAPPRRPNTNGRSKQDGPTSSTTTHGAKSTSNVPQTVNDDGSDQKSLKVRIRVGPDNNSSNTRNAEIYSGLGLDVSPSSSFEISPVDSDGFFHAPRDGPDESPTSILEMMTSFPICGSRLLSPLPYDILHLTEKKSEDSICGPVHKTSQESTVTALHGTDSGKADQNAPGEKPKSSETTNTLSMESTNGIDVQNDTGIVAKETEQVNGNKGSAAGKAREANDEENNSGFPTKADSDVSSGSKTRYVKKPREGEKVRKIHDGMKSGHGSKTSSSLDGKRKPKSRVDGSKSGKNDHVSKSYTEDFKKNSGNVRETTYKDFFGELDLEPEDPDLEKRSRDEKVAVENKVVKKSEKPSLYPRGADSHVPLVGNGVGSGAGVTTVGPVVKEDWVGCDKCEKWRLLPPGVNPKSLPEKWLCSMLDWLPGMNRCSISEEETTSAITSRFAGPLVQGSQPVHPGGPQLDASCPEGRNRHLGSEIPSSGVKKKHESKDLTNEAKQERPSLSSNSAKKNLHTSYKSRSVNGGNRSPRVNESEFQDSGQSRDVIAEKDGLKRKENNKNVVDEGNIIHQSKANNKRASSQDFPRDFKKAKTDAIHGPDEDRISDHGGAVFKPSCSSSSGLPPGISRKDHGKLDHRPKDTKPASKDVAKKRKLNEFVGTDKYVKEASENNGRKEKKSRVLSKSNDEGKNVTVAATSSSSKVSGSRKTKPDNEETKGSPVESVSSSPLRVLNTDKFTSSKRTEKIVPENNGKEKIESFSGFPGTGVGTSGHGTSSHGHNSNGPRSRKHGKGSSSRSKEKNGSRYEITEKGTQRPEPLNKNVDLRASQEKPKEGRKLDKLVNGAKTHGESNSRDLKQLPKRDVSGKGKPQSLPPKGQNGTERLPEPIPGYPKENVGKPNKKAQNPNGKQPISTKNSMPDVNGGGNKEGPLTVVRDISNQRDIANQATTTALREATNLKHMADRMKNSGSSLESRALYIQAALKFLHVASLFETCHSQTGRYGDMIQSVSIYGSTAKLCEYCAHEFERTKEMATASLAYKCMEVAYLKVIYSSHGTACKDVNELQTSLPIGPTGESPSSSASASDLDNMNNPATVDKAAVPKGLNAPQVAGNHVITARNKPNFMRILNFAQDVNSAMEASRKSRSCFAASNAKEEAIQSAVKKALDFNFHDVKELLRLVRVAMEVISR